MKKAIIIGATSGIGLALARLMLRRGYQVGVTGRRTHLLKQLRQEMGAKTYIQMLDVSRPEEAQKKFGALLQQMGGLDLLIVNAGVDPPDPSLEWAPEFATVQVNVVGFLAMVNAGVRHFLGQGSGHLVGISSIAGIRGNGRSPVYGATKAFESHLLEGLRQRLFGSGISVTDIRPGFVDTDMVRDRHWTFWMASPEKAACQILDAVEKKKKAAYITKRWGLIAQLYSIIPDWLYDVLFAWLYRRKS